MFGLFNKKPQTQTGSETDLAKVILKSAQIEIGWEDDKNFFVIKLNTNGNEFAPILKNSESRSTFFQGIHNQIKSTDWYQNDPHYKDFPLQFPKINLSVKHIYVDQSGKVLFTTEI